MVDRYWSFVIILLFDLFISTLSAKSDSHFSHQRCQDLDWISWWQKLKYIYWTLQKGFVNHKTIIDIMYTFVFIVENRKTKYKILKGDYNEKQWFQCWYDNQGYIYGNSIYRRQHTNLILKSFDSLSVDLNLVRSVLII